MIKIVFVKFVYACMAVFNIIIMSYQGYGSVSNYPIPIQCHTELAIMVTMVWLGIN